MADLIDPLERIDQLLASAEPRIANIFSSAIRELKDQLDLDQLEKLIAEGRVNEALDVIMGVAQALGSASNIVFITSGQSTAQFLASAGVGRVVFDIVNERAVQQMAASSLRLIRAFTSEQVGTVRAALVSGIQQGLNPRDVARNFRDVVGLTETQAAAVLNFRRLLERVGDAEAQDQREALTRALRDQRYDRTIERAVASGQPLSRQQIDRMVTRYGERYVKYRAEVIGRTEALRSVHQGVEEAYNQAFDRGILMPWEVEQQWNTSIDGRERPSHHDLHRMRLPVGRPFPGRASPIRYPGDPEAAAEETVQCRCRLTRRIRQAKG